MKVLFKFCFICVCIIGKIIASVQLNPELNNLLSSIPQEITDQTRPFDNETTNNHPKDPDKRINSNQQTDTKEYNRETKHLPNAKRDKITAEIKRYKRQENTEDYLPIIEAEDYDYVTQNIKNLFIESADYNEANSEKKDDKSPLLRDFNVDKGKPKIIFDNNNITVFRNSTTINNRGRSPIAKKSKIHLRMKKIPRKLSRKKSVTSVDDDDDNDYYQHINIEPDETEDYRADNLKTPRKSNRKPKSKLERKSKIKRKYIKMDDEDSKNNSPTLSTNETHVLVNQSSKIANDRKQINVQKLLEKDLFASSVSEEEEEEDKNLQAEKPSYAEIILLQMNDNQTGNAQLEKSVSNNIGNKSINIIDKRQLQVIKESEQSRKQQNESDQLIKNSIKIKPEAEIQRQLITNSKEDAENVSAGYEDKITSNVKEIEQNYNGTASVNKNVNPTELRSTKIINNEKITIKSREITSTENETKSKTLRTEEIKENPVPIKAITSKAPILRQDNNYTKSGFKEAIQIDPKLKYKALENTNNSGKYLANSTIPSEVTASNRLIKTPKIKENFPSQEIQRSFKENTLHKQAVNSKATSTPILLTLPEDETELLGEETSKSSSLLLQGTRISTTENVLNGLHETGELSDLQSVTESKIKVFSARPRAIDKYQQDKETLNHQILEKPVMQNYNDTYSEIFYADTTILPEINSRDKFTEISEIGKKMYSQEIQNLRTLKPDGDGTKSAPEFTTSSQIKESNSNSSFNARVALNLQDRIENQRHKFITDFQQALSYPVLEKPMVQNVSKNKKNKTTTAVTPTPAELASRADSQEIPTTPKRIKKRIQPAITANVKNIREKDPSSQNISHSFRLQKLAPKSDHEELSQPHQPTTKTNVKKGINKGIEETANASRSEEIVPHSELHHRSNTFEIKSRNLNKIPVTAVTSTKTEESTTLTLAQNVEITRSKYEKLSQEMSQRQDELNPTSDDQDKSPIIEKGPIENVEETGDREIKVTLDKPYLNNVLKKDRIKTRSQEMLNNNRQMNYFPLFREMPMSPDTKKRGENKATSAFKHITDNLQEKMGKLFGKKHTRKAKHLSKSFSPKYSERMSSRQSYKSLGAKKIRNERSRHHRKKNRLPSKISYEASTSKHGKRKLKQLHDIETRQADDTNISKIKEDTAYLQNKLKELEKDMNSHSFTMNDIQNDINFLLSDIKEIRTKFKKEEKLFDSTLDLQKLEAEKLSKQVNNLEEDIKSIEEKVKVYFKNESYAEMQLKQVSERVSNIADIQISLDDLIYRMNKLENKTKFMSIFESQLGDIPKSTEQQQQETPPQLQQQQQQQQQKKRQQQERQQQERQQQETHQQETQQETQQKQQELQQQIYNLNDRVEILSNKTDNIFNDKLQTNVTSMKAAFEISVNEIKEDVSSLHRNLEDLAKQFETLKLENVDNQDQDTWRDFMNKIDKTHNHKEAILMKKHNHLEDKLEKIMTQLKIRDQAKNIDVNNKKISEKPVIRSSKLKKTVSDQNERHNKYHPRKRHHHKKKSVAELDKSAEPFKVFEVDLPPHLRKMGHHDRQLVIKAKLI